MSTAVKNCLIITLSYFLVFQTSCKTMTPTSQVKDFDPDSWGETLKTDDKNIKSAVSMIGSVFTSAVHDSEFQFVQFKKGGDAAKTISREDVLRLMSENKENEIFLSKPDSEFLLSVVPSVKKSGSNRLVLNVKRYHISNLDRVLDGTSVVFSSLSNTSIASAKKQLAFEMQKMNSFFKQTFQRDHNTKTIATAADLKAKIEYEKKAYQDHLDRNFPDYSQMKDFVNSSFLYDMATNPITGVFFHYIIAIVAFGVVGFTFEVNGVMPPYLKRELIMVVGVATLAAAVAVSLYYFRVKYVDSVDNKVRAIEDREIYVNWRSKIKELNEQYETLLNP